MNSRKQRIAVWICAIMIFLGICLFINAISGLVISRGRERAQGEETQIQEVPLQNDSADADNSEETAVQSAVTAGSTLDLPQTSEKIKYIETHTDLYPDSLLSLLSRNVETVDFIYSYPDLVEAGLNTEEAAETVTLTEEEVSGGHPLLLQWDVRWGAIPYGSSMMALSGCGPTCLSMVVVGLTGNEEANPAAVAMYAMQEGYYMEGTGTAWSLFTEGSSHYGLNAEEISLSEEVMVEELQNDSMIICSVSKGDFTQSGHFIVIYGYEDGAFLLNDPNSIARSNEEWTYETLEGQIRNLWALSEM